MFPENPRDGAFIVRIWWEWGDDRALWWRGRVVHAQTHRSAYFDDISEMVKFIEHWSGIEPLPVSPGEHDRQIAENDCLDKEDEDLGGIK
jgi:hypothetical protein